MVEDPGWQGTFALESALDKGAHIAFLGPNLTLKRS